MAVEKFYDAGVFFNGWNLTGQTNKMTLTRKVAMLDTSVFGIETKVNSPGLDETALNISGWWYAQDTVGTQAPDPNLFNSLGSPTGSPLLVFPKNQMNEPAYFFPAVQGVFNFFGAFGELAPFSADFSYSQYGATGTRVKHCRGVLGLPYAAYAAATGNGTYIQYGAPLTANDWLVLTVHVVSTDGSVVVVLESDDNSGFSSPTTRITSPSLSGGGSYIADLQGPIATDTYFRLKYTRTGGTTFTAVAAHGKTTPAGLGA
jgi:hypothetical protein